MTRPAPVCLRALSRGERSQLNAKVREVSLPARLHGRYWVIALVRGGASIPQAAGQAGLPCRARICIDAALTPPPKLGLPFTTWSVRTLNAYCQRKKLLPPFCDEWVRQLLRRSRLAAQRIRTWKQSDDRSSAPKPTHPRPRPPLPAALGGRQARTTASATFSEYAYVPRHRAKRSSTMIALRPSSIA